MLDEYWHCLPWVDTERTAPSVSAVAVSCHHQVEYSYYYPPCCHHWFYYYTRRWSTVYRRYHPISSSRLLLSADSQRISPLLIVCLQINVTKQWHVVCFKLIDWSIGLMIDWLIDWLIDWSNDWSNKSIDLLLGSGGVGVVLFQQHINTMCQVK